MAKKVTDMSSEKPSIRSLCDEKYLRIITDWADLEGRSQQQHTGILLERLAKLYKNHPNKLEEIGLLTPHLLEPAA